MHIDNLLFMGTAESMKNCERNITGSVASSQDQTELLKNLHEIGVKNALMFSQITKAAYPRDIIFNRRRKDNIDGVFDIIILPYINLRILKELSVVFTILWNYFKTYKFGKPDIIMVYNSVISYSLPALLISKIFGIPAVMIVADFSPPSSNRGFLKNFISRILLYQIKGYAGLIVYSEHIIKDFKLRNFYIRQDCGRDDNFKDYSLRPLLNHKETIVVMYSGNLNRHSGIELLLETFSFLDRGDIELWISGRGELENKINIAVAKDKRIKFFGFAEREKYLQLLSCADILINPRLSKIPDHRYNFPSKLLEYMVTGKPVITTATGDFQEEFKDKVFILENETPQELARLIEAVCNMPVGDRNAFGRKAREYILAKRNRNISARRIYKFLTEVLRLENKR